MKMEYTSSIPLMNSVKFSFQYLQKPWAVVPALLNKRVRVHIKGSTDGGLILQGKNDFWKLRNLVNAGWDIDDVRDGLLFLEKDGIIISGKLWNLSVLQEPLEKQYRIFEYKNKVVLDIGGFIGYSAVIFSRWGAKKLIVYEAQRENIDVIRRNLKLNKVNGEVYNLAVSTEDGYIELPYTSLGSTTVGLEGDKKYRVKSVSLAKVLSKHQVDIAKFDCEGCEYSILSVPCEILRKVPRYVIEYHREFAPLKRKFEDCGYSVKHLWNIKEGIGGFKAEVSK